MLNRSTKVVKYGVPKTINRIYPYQFLNLNSLPTDRRILYKQLSLKNVDTYYLSKDEVLSFFVGDIFTDPKFALATANFAAKEFKIRTSIQVIVGQVSYLIKTQSRNYLSSDLESLMGIITKHFNSWITRPDILADVVWTYSYLSGESIKKIPTFLRKLIKARLETFDRKQLLKHKLERREIKLKDLIKLYRPKPATVELAKVYKEIIESKQKLDTEEFIRLVSDDKISKEKLTEKLTNKLKSDAVKIKTNKKSQFNIPLNALLKNLSKFAEDNDPEIIDLIKTRLTDAIDNDVKILNPFDLLIQPKGEVMYGEIQYHKLNISRDLIAMLNKQILKSFENIRFRFLEDFDIILDISGSMFSMDKVVTTCKYLTLLIVMANLSGVKVRLNLFHDGLLERDRNLMIFHDTEIHPILPEGFRTIMDYYSYLDKALTSTDFANRPLDIFNFLLNEFGSNLMAMQSGTQMERSVNRYFEKAYCKKEVVILSDEMTWDDSTLDRLTFFYSERNRQATGRAFILINPEPMSNLTPFSIHENVIRISGINPKFFTYQLLTKNFEEFKKQMLEDIE